jgi:hypothetical protein
LDLNAVAEGRTVCACAACGTKHQVDAAVHVFLGRVTTLEDADREEEVLDDVRRFRTLEVSDDNGATWQQKKVNAFDADPETSVLKPGYLLRVPGSSRLFLMALEAGRLTAGPAERESA